MSGPRRSKDGEAPWWYVLRDAETWTLLEASYICCNKPIVTDDEVRVTKKPHGADIKSMAQRLRAEVRNKEVRTRFWRTYDRIFQSAAVKAWAKQNGYSMPWEASAESPPSSATSTETLLRQIGVLALLLAAEKPGLYRHGEKPNASRIAEAVQAILDEQPDANTHGLGNRSLRDNIAAGLEDLLAEDGKTAVDN